MKQSIHREVRAELDEFRSISEEELQDAQRRELADSEEMARIEDEEGIYRRRLMLSGIDPDTRERFTPEQYQAVLSDLDPDWDERRMVDISLAGGNDVLDFLEDDEDGEEFDRMMNDSAASDQVTAEARRAEEVLLKKFLDTL